MCTCIPRSVPEWDHLVPGCVLLTDEETVAQSLADFPKPPSWYAVEEDCELCSILHVLNENGLCPQA